MTERYCKNKNQIFALTATLLLLIPWCVHIGHKALNHDVIWFITAASRWLAGQTMEQGCYDPNPPLGFLIYLPVIGLQRLAGIPWDNGIIVYTLALLMIAAAAFYALLRRLALRDGEALFLTLLFVLCGTIIDFEDFGQRDQFIAFALAPFMTGQIILTRRLDAPRPLLNAVFFTGALLIWLRPYFWFLPVCMQIHRAVVQRRLTVWQDADFIALTAVSIVYVAGVRLFFPDFVHFILPDVQRLYLPGEIEQVVGRASILSALFGIGLLLSFMPGCKDGPAAAFFAAALVCLAVFVVQFRDYLYHLAPALMFFWLGLGQLLLRPFQRLLPPVAAAVFCLTAMAAIGYTLHPSGGYPTRQQMANLPLTRIVASCGPDCGLSGLGIWARAAQLVPYYAGKEHASRFSDWWFVPELMRQSELIGTDHPGAWPALDYERLFEKYASYIAADLGRWPHSMVLVCDETYLRYFLASPVFVAAWRGYEPIEKISFSYAAFYPIGMKGVNQSMVCQLYKRNT